MPDQALCINNLYTLSKQKNIKIRALETSCGVSVGYLARLRQDVRHPLPGLDFLVRAAALLEMTVDSLLYFDFQLSSETDRRLEAFISRLTLNTLRETLRWDADHACVPDPVILDGVDFPSHPLLGLDPVLLQENKSKQYYASPFHPADYSLVPLSAWTAVLSEDTVIYLAAVSSAEDVSGKKKSRQSTELYLYNREHSALSPLCCTDAEHPGLLDRALSVLCETVSESLRRTALDQYAVRAIDAYMNSGKEDSLG